MPARNAQKQYLGNSYYHLYNRGVEKRQIFLDAQDYLVFLSYLKEYLSPKDEQVLREKLADKTLSYKERDKILKQLRLNNFASDITLLAYCLMPNHFHFFIKQVNPTTIDQFMNSLATRYTMYFNKKYKRVGPLYQGVYKGVLISNEEQFLHLSRYIHKQALALQGEALQELPEQPSSYFEYVGKRNTIWIHPEEVLSYFSNTIPHLSYEAFIKEIDNSLLLQNIIIEEYHNR